MPAPTRIFRPLVGGTLMLTLVLTSTACSGFGPDEGSWSEADSDSPQAAEPTEEPDDDPSASQQSLIEYPKTARSPAAPGSTITESPAVEIESVTVEVPQDWTLQEAPEDYSPSGWSAGAVDDEPDSAQAIRILPEMDEPAAKAGASRLIATGELPEVYGASFEVTGNRSSDIAGAQQSRVIDFRYREDGAEIAGRWWVLADSQTDTIAVVEYIRSPESEPDFATMAEGISFDPDWEAS